VGVDNGEAQGKHYVAGSSLSISPDARSIFIDVDPISEHGNEKPKLHTARKRRATADTCNDVETTTHSGIISLHNRFTERSMTFFISTG